MLRVCGKRKAVKKRKNGIGRFWGIVRRGICLKDSNFECDSGKGADELESKQYIIKQRIGIKMRMLQ